MSEEEVKANKAKASNRRIEKQLFLLLLELEELEKLDGMAYIETLTEVKMKIRKLK